MSLRGKRALITGAGQGIGRAIAAELHGLGVELVLLGRRREPLEELRITVPGEIVLADVSRPDEVERARQQAGGVDILVNNAGIAHSAPVKSLRLLDWERLMATNATGLMLMCQAFLPSMAERGWGRIVNIASVAARAGGKYLAAYAASKHAVLGFTRSLAEEVAAQGITVNAVCPGFVDTPMTEQTLANIMAKTGMSREDAEKSLTRFNPQGRLIEAEEVAYWVGCLCHPRGRGVNGQALILDGGGLLA
jgi:NAD(P)-dependent dehydrogenase (short-subunit alcohol dehydrogenase family)